MAAPPLLADVTHRVVITLTGPHSFRVAFSAGGAQPDSRVVFLDEPSRVVFPVAFSASKGLSAATAIGPADATYVGPHVVGAAHAHTTEDGAFVCDNTLIRGPNIVVEIVAGSPSATVLDDLTEGIASALFTNHKKFVEANVPNAAKPRFDVSALINTIRSLARPSSSKTRELEPTLRISLSEANKGLVSSASFTSTLSVNGPYLKNNSVVAAPLIARPAGATMVYVHDAATDTWSSRIGTRDASVLDIDGGYAFTGYVSFDGNFNKGACTLTATAHTIFVRPSSSGPGVEEMPALPMPEGYAAVDDASSAVMTEPIALKTPRGPRAIVSVPGAPLRPSGAGAFTAATTFVAKKIAFDGAAGKKRARVPSIDAEELEAAMEFS